MELLTIKEAARKLQVHPATLLRAIQAGQLKAVAIGRGYRVSEQNLTAWIASRRVPVKHTVEIK